MRSGLKNIQLALVFSVVSALLLSGCGGSGGGTSTPTQTPTITGFSPSTGPAGTVVTITGTNFDPVAGNNSVKFNGTQGSVMGATTTSLTVSVPSSSTTGAISVTKSNVTATSQNSFSVTAEPPLSYPAATVTPRANFVKGVFTMDVGGFMPDTLSQGLFEPTYDRIRSQVGANLVANSDPVLITSSDPVNGTVTMSKSGPANTRIKMLTSAEYSRLVSAAHSRNLKFMLLLGVYPATSDVQQPWGVSPQNTAFWDAWFAAYTPIVLEYATIARDLNIDYLSLGMNSGYMSGVPVTYWTNLVNSIRATGYSGKLVYQALTFPQFSGTGEFQGFNDGWSAANPSERFLKNIEFAKLFDVIILDIINVAFNRTSPDAITRDEMKQTFRWYLGEVSQYPVPVMVMLATPSASGGGVNPDYIEPCIICGSVAPSRQVNFQLQADAYQSLAEVINESPTSNVVGVLSWGYWFSDDFYRWGDLEMAYDKAASVRGKPSEAVLKWWFDRW
jgi:hypothetical protein